MAPQLNSLQQNKIYCWYNVYVLNTEETR